MNEANRFIESLMTQLCFDKANNTVLDVEEKCDEFYRHVALKDTVLGRNLLCFHEDHGMMVFTVGIPCKMLHSEAQGEDLCYQFQLNLDLYQEVISMANPLQLKVPACARIYAS